MRSVFEIEEAVIGTMLNSPACIPEVLDKHPTERWNPANQAIVEALHGMSEFDEEITVLTLAERLTQSGVLNRVGGLPRLFKIYQYGYDYGSLMLVDTLAAEHLRNEVRAIGMRMVQRSENLTVEPEEILEWVADQLGQVQAAPMKYETEGWPESDENPEPEWVVPGLLATDERVMITGKEGLGKTMLIRQLVCAVVVGKHPFLHHDFEPAPALHVDLENPQWVSDAAYRKIRNALRDTGTQIPDLLHRVAPRQFDVENPRDVNWLLGLVRTVRPRLIAIGPLKNMSSQDLDKEANAVKVQVMLNRIRAESNAVLVLEGHAGHSSRGDEGDWRPRGSSSFLGWPEFGFGLKPISIENPRAAELIRWRGSRVDQRFWPEFIVEGYPWPWVEDPRLGK